MVLNFDDTVLGRFQTETDYEPSFAYERSLAERVFRKLGYDRGGPFLDTLKRVYARETGLPMEHTLNVGDDLSETITLYLYSDCKDLYTQDIKLINKVLQEYRVTAGDYFSGTTGDKTLDIIDTIMEMIILAGILMEVCGVNGF